MKEVEMDCNFQDDELLQNIIILEMSLKVGTFQFKQFQQKNVTAFSHVRVDSANSWNNISVFRYRSAEIFPNTSSRTKAPGFGGSILTQQQTLCSCVAPLLHHVWILTLVAQYWLLNYLVMLELAPYVVWWEL